MLSNLYVFEGVLSIVNIFSLIIIVFFLEKNLRMSWILKDELNAFSVLLFCSLGGLLLRETLFLWSLLGGYFVGLKNSITLITSTTPWLVINVIVSLALLGTAVIILFKNSKIFIINKSGKIWFKVVKKK